MQMPNLKIEGVVASKNDVRLNLQEPYLDVENRRMVATNGHAAVVVPVEIEDGDTSGHISVESIIAARKVAPERKRQHKTIRVAANGTLVLNNGASFPRSILGTYPNIDMVIPQRTYDTISIDAERLLELAQAICLQGETPMVTIHLSEDRNSGMRVERLKGDSDKGAFGVIMPCRKPK